MFLDPALQPPQQSPQPVQAGWATPAGLTVSAKLTATGAATRLPPPSAAPARASAWYLVRPAALRVGRRPHPAGRAGVALVDEAVPRHLLRPHGIAEHARIGPERDAGVDERAAPQAAAHQDVHVLAQPHIVEPGGRAHAHPPARHLQLLPELGEAARELAGQELPPPLQHRHALAGPGEPRRRHPAAVARAHHHRVIVRPQAVQGAGKAGHGHLGVSLRLRASGFGSIARSPTPDARPTLVGEGPSRRQAQAAHERCLPATTCG